MAAHKRVTIADIARFAGVSPGAVSFALNDRPGVSQETRERILAIAAEHHWQPSRAARALGGSRLGVIGLVVERPARTLGTEAFFTDLISGIQSGLAAANGSLQLRMVTDTAGEIATYRAWAGSHQVDGVIVIDPRDDDPRFAVLDEVGLPAVVLGSAPSAPGEHAAVWLDDRAAAHTLFDYIAALGHRRIAYVSGPESFQPMRLRAEVLTGLAGRGVAGIVEATDFSLQAAAETTRRLLSSAERPTAVVYDNDVMAVSGLRVTQEMGVAVPGELSIASFDDSVMTELMRPSITSLTRDTVGVGELAAGLLITQLDSPEPVPSIPGPAPRLTARESTAPPHA